MHRKSALNYRSLNKATASVVESLERRRLLSITAPDSSGTVIVDDSAATSGVNVLVTFDSSSNSFVFNDNGTIQSFAASTVVTTQIHTGSGNDTVEIDASFPATVGNPGVLGLDNEVTTGAGSDTVFGSPGREFIFLGNNSNTDGNSLVFANGGDDDIEGGNGNDTLNGGMGDDTIHGGLGNDEVHGGKNADNLAGNDGNDTIFGGKGNDVEEGGNGYDQILGALGDDLLEGGQQGDSIYGGGGNDTLSGGKGYDILGGDDEDSIIFVGGVGAGNVGNDQMTAGLGQDTVLAHTGNDVIFGGTGDANTPDNASNVIDPGSNTHDTIRDNQAGTATGGGTGFVATDILTSQSPQVYSGTTAVNLSASLKIVIDGQTVDLPAGSGSFTTGTSIAQVTSVAGDGTATVQFTSDTTRTFTLNDFFNQWGTTVGANHVGRFSANDNGHTITMTVNGVVVPGIKTYQIVGGENIVITYV